MLLIKKQRILRMMKFILLSAVATMTKDKEICWK